MDESESAMVSMARSSAAVPANRGTRPSPAFEQSPMRGGSRRADALRQNHRHGDAIFRMLVGGSGGLLLVIMAAIAVFLIIQAIPALQANTTSFFFTLKWEPDAPQPSFGIAALAFGSVLTSLLALLMSVPVAVGVALSISHYAPRWLAGPLAFVVDLLAAVPSVVFGQWGLLYLVPNIDAPSRLLHNYLGFIPLFGSNGTYGKSVFAASVVLAVMVIPIVAAISREVFIRVPREHIEAAWSFRGGQWNCARIRSGDRGDDSGRAGVVIELCDLVSYLRSGGKHYRGQHRQPLWRCR
jgi:phosphate transport system permease protein